MAQTDLKKMVAYSSVSHMGYCLLGMSALTQTGMNGALMQSGSTADLIFGVDELVEYISHVAPLEAGDMILTGTPDGVGVFRDPPVFLRPGDRLRCEIAGIGALELPIESV